MPKKLCFAGEVLFKSTKNVKVVNASSVCYMSGAGKLPAHPALK